MAFTNANDNALPDGPLVLRAQAGERAASSTNVSDGWWSYWKRS